MRRWPAPSYPTGTRHPHPSRSFRPTVRPVLSVRSPACLASTDKNGSASSLPSASSSLRHSYPHVRRLYYFSHLAYSTQVPAVCEGQTGTLETEKPIIRIFFDVWGDDSDDDPSGPSYRFLKHEDKRISRTSSAYYVHWSICGLRINSFPCIGSARAKLRLKSVDAGIMR